MPAIRRAQRLACVSLVAIIVAATAGLPTLSAKDWPQWRGAERLGLWTETGILDEFPDAGLTVKWRVPVNGGYSGPAVADGRVFVLDYVETEARVMNGTERLLALSEETGEVLWSHEWETTYRMLMFTYATGPRATPTVDGDRTHLMEPTSRSGYSGTRGARRARHGDSDRLVVWAHPAFANRHLVLRNDEEIIRVSMDANDY